MTGKSLKREEEKMNIKDLLKDSYKEGMTSEELLKLFESVDVVPTSDFEKLKASLSKSNSEASASKKAKAEADSTVESLKAEIEALTSKKASLEPSKEELVIKENGTFTHIAKVLKKQGGVLVEVTMEDVMFDTATKFIKR